MPVDVEFFYLETKELLRPYLVLHETYAEAVQDLNAKLLEQSHDIATKEEIEEVHISVLDLQEDEVEELNDTQDVQDFRNVDEEYEKSPDSDVHSESDRESDDADYDSEAENDEQLFDLEFSRMMHDSLESRKNERKTSFDAPIPSNSKIVNASDKMDASKVTFTLLTKRGNKQQHKRMHLPSDSTFAISSLSAQRAEQEERSKVKELVLNLEERDRQQQNLQPGDESVIPTPYSSVTKRGRRGRGQARGLWRALS